MTISTNIEDGTGTSNKAQVTIRGQLVVGAIDYSTAFTVTANVINTGFNFVPPIAGKRFVITDLLLDAGKDVSSSTAGTVIIYEAVAVDTVTIDKTILSIEMLKNTNRVITGINLIIVSEGRWINIKTTDATVTGTILGYYVDA